MLGSIFSTIGASLGSRIGKYFGGGILSSIGRYAGSYLGKYAGSYLDKQLFGFADQKSSHGQRTIQKHSNLKASFVLSLAKPGTPIPLSFGKTRLPGQIIWADSIKKTTHTASSSKYFTLPNLAKSTTHYIEHKYFLSFAMCICEGEIQEITRVWNGNEPVNIGQYKFTLHKGTPFQMPDPCIQRKMNAQAPAFRDLAYIVFENLPLEDFGNVIPDLSFEVTRGAATTNNNMLEDLVKSMVMIPGCGEYVYDTIIQRKELLTSQGAVITDKPVNSHNAENIADSVYSLNQLQSICRNIEWVAPVVCWFADSLDIERCSIMPAVEFRDPAARFSTDWQVGPYNRSNAYEITKDARGNPRYGGSVNDASLVRYLQELKRRNLKIMFYPMFFMDIDRKPWRGNLTGSAAHVRDFFRKERGYNEFILHYANLVKDHVDAFIIGSELIGLTKIKAPGNTFPAVDELIRLAGLVKTIVGERVQVSYAADWSEYHHTEGGWFNLDPLWMSPAIDFIGIDAYFPLTNSEGSFITSNDIRAGFDSGEGYDYYIDSTTGVRHDLAPAYAWKNIRYWWENTHRNPDGSNSLWRPRAKKIWFTEYGFPSIDKASNQPNIFFDPDCVSGGVPKHSNGETDFAIQRKAIREFIRFWSTQEYISNMFLWTWDARPYPAWPHMNIWKDGNLWEKGHWVNDKFGTASVASIILEISARCRLDLRHIETTSIDEILGGIVFTSQISGKDAISILRSSYFFDITASSGEKIVFVKRGSLAPVALQGGALVKLSDNSYINETIIAKDQILNKVDIYFTHHLQDYKICYLHINNEEYSNLKTATLRLPMTLSPMEANRIGRLLLKNAASETKLLEFCLPISHIDLEPADFIMLEYGGQEYALRIVGIVISGLVMNVSAIIDDITNYHNIQLSGNRGGQVYQETVDTNLQIVELPVRRYGIDFPHLMVHLNSQARLPLEIRIKSDIAGNPVRIASIAPTNSIAKIVSFDGPIASRTNFCLIDNLSLMEVRGHNLDRFNNNGQWNLMLVDSELIGFKFVRKMRKMNDLYGISHLVRGVYGTERHAKKHQPGSVVTIIAGDATIIPVVRDLTGEVLEFRVGGDIASQDIQFMDQASMPIRALIIRNELKNNNLYLNWVSRNFRSDGWSRVITFPAGFCINVIDQGRVHKFTSSAGTNKIVLDVSALTLSSAYKVDIIQSYTS